MPKRTKIVAGVFLVPMVLLVAGEVAARALFGLGDPPLTVRDPDIEYMFKPGAYNRFGNTVIYNEYSMRSPSLSAARAPGSLRVLVLGDSVVNGGGLTDQKELATELLAARLPSGSWVGNVSAGSWGPANLAAYLRRFGTFDADVIFVVLSSHDLNDVPTFEKDLGSDFPEVRPTLALQEAWERYLPRYLPFLREAQAEANNDPAGLPLGSSGADEVDDLVGLLAATPARVEYILHPEVEELSSGPNQNGRAIRELLDQLGVRYTDMAPYRDADKYRDPIHLNANGQKAYADAFTQMMIEPTSQIGSRTPQVWRHTR